MKHIPEVALFHNFSSMFCIFSRQMKTVLPVHPSVVVVSAALAHCPCFELDCVARGMPLGNQWPRDFLHKDGQPKNYLFF